MVETGHYQMIVAARAVLPKNRDLHVMLFQTNEKAYYICDMH